MTKPIQDQMQRERALDPRQSFIVQAPAGSGKTELLTQRFLKLLSCVNEPEEILAITFTKKAASEMRSRIRDALLRAKQETEPEAAHEKKTWLLATKALKQDENRNWGLLTNPNRLRIKTIDAFNTLLTRQLPLLSHFGASPDILEYPQALYREAVQIFLSHLEENLSWSNSIAQLLLHLDNNLQNTEELLIEMLSKRDHWLPYIMAHQGALEDKEQLPGALRQMLEANLAAVIRETLTKLRASFPPESVPELLRILKFACSNLKHSHPDSPLLLVEELSALPATTIEAVPTWRAIAAFLLTKDESWRKSLDKNIGFPANEKAKTAENELNKISKQAMKDLLEQFSEQEPLYDALLDLLYLPDPHYTDKQWKILKALHEVLKIVVAQLNVIFKLSGKIDYTENALAGLLSLGTEEAPTDLALALDYQLKHILVDEFQDTSTNQYELLKKLVNGWQPDDGRTLFLVGDPMQSIYRFREADVGLFLRARQQGIGCVELQALTLSVNFRSTPAIVNWINTHFDRVFPAYDDIASGAVSYTPSTACKPNNDQNAVVLHAFVDAEANAQASALIPLLQSTLAENPEGSIAILVRSRAHLLTLIPALKAAKLAYQAVDIDPLQTRPLIQDLLALTRCLFYPADHVAWLSILRAPWCGLSLNDLLLLAGNRQQSLIWQRLHDNEVLRQLSPEGQKRLVRILPIIQSAIAERHREDLQLWVEKTWVLLGGPACVAHESDLQDAKIFFALLKKLAQNESSLSLKWASLEEAIKQLYAQSSIEANCRIQIMTIHNAKGLEFDTVILPQLQKGSGKNDKTLLTWLERPLENNSTALLLAPIHAIGDEEDKIYHHIRRQDKNKTQYEQSRLIYVAVTRAKKALHLFMSLESNDKGELKVPADSSMLKKLWPVIKNDLEVQASAPNPSLVADDSPHFLKRLRADWRNPETTTLATVRRAHNTIPGFHLRQGDAQAVGIVVHYLLQQIACFGLDWWQARKAEQRQHFIQAQALEQGISLTELAQAGKKIELAIQNTLADPRGQWLLKKHSEAKAELALTAVFGQEAKMLILDRTFVDENNLRWIIDYKTTVPEEQELAIFLREEQEKHRDQLEQYRHALQQLDKRPIALGLYFPLVPAWCEWQNN